MEHVSVNEQYMYYVTFLMAQPNIFKLMFSQQLKKIRQYIQADKDERLSQEVIELLKQPRHPSLKTISLDSGIPYGTIKNWNKKLKENNDYFPGKQIAKHLRLFTEEEEKNIADLIKTQFIQ